MHTEFLMGNEAIALGALAAGVRVVAGYPGTPSTEVLETIAARNPGNVYVEWSINEKAGMEVAAGAACAGARALVTMKQVGLNVASDPLMSLEYLGVKGGMVVLVADDPGPISSQTEQDTRTFAEYSKVPCFDPSSVAEAYEMIQTAFKVSENNRTPVFLRPTTRIDHGYEAISVKDPAEYDEHPIEGFVKDPSRWVIFPRLSVQNHALLEARNDRLAKAFSSSGFNALTEAAGSYAEEDSEGSRLGIVSGGISWSYLGDALSPENHPRLLKIGTPFPFPERLAARFLKGLTEVLVLEELDPYLERALTYVCGKEGLNVRIHGKLDGTVKRAGENTVDEIRALVSRFAGEAGVKPAAGSAVSADAACPPLPVRPPVLCAGCPHRASFYAVKTAMKGQKTLYCGDIGCYTLGNAKPLDMTDTCLCMGAGIDMAQGVWHVEPDTKAFAFVGDSTFFASGIPGTVNGLFNQADMTLVVLDNSTTAMTGHQPHPGTGVTMMGDIVNKIDIESTLRGIGVKTVETVNPLQLDEAVETVRRVADEPGLKAVIFKYPCIVKFKPKGAIAHVDPDKCISCKRCINEIGCPGVILKDGKAFIDESLCTGCTLCEQICPAGAIAGGEARGLGGLVAAQQDEERRARLEQQGDPGEKAKALAAAMRPGEGFADRNADAFFERPDAPAPSAAPEKDIIITGVGGQGTILASRLISAAAMAQGLPVKTAETIGMAQRGGSVFSCLKFGGTPQSPLIGTAGADLILGFEPGEAVRMLPRLKAGGTVITSTRPVIPVTAMVGGAPYDPDAMLAYLKEQVPDLILVDAGQALKDIGNPKVLNVLLLGAAAESGALGLSADELKAALAARLPKKLLDINMVALDYGRRIAREQNQ